MKGRRHPAPQSLLPSSIQFSTHARSIRFCQVVVDGTSSSELAQALNALPATKTWTVHLHEVDMILVCKAEWAAFSALLSLELVASDSIRGLGLQSPGPRSHEDICFAWLILVQEKNPTSNGRVRGPHPTGPSCRSCQQLRR